jgi:hypothetical protein
MGWIKVDESSDIRQNFTTASHPVEYWLLDLKTRAEVWTWIFDEMFYRSDQGSLFLVTGMNSRHSYFLVWWNTFKFQTSHKYSHFSLDKSSETRYSKTVDVKVWHDIEHGKIPS